MDLCLGSFIEVSLQRHRFDISVVKHETMFGTLLLWICLSVWEMYLCLSLPPLRLSVCIVVVVVLIVRTSSKQFCRKEAASGLTHCVEGSPLSYLHWQTECSGRAWMLTAVSNIVGCKLYTDHVSSGVSVCQYRVQQVQIEYLELERPASSCSWQETQVFFGKRIKRAAFCESIIGLLLGSRWNL